MTEIKVLNKMTAVPEETPVINVSMSNAAYQGPPGYTPIKGIDYFTEDEKNEIIEAAKVGANSAADISYDNNENQIENIETVQKALDFLFDKSLDEIAVENILIEKNYQNKEQVDEAISEAIENIDIPEVDMTGYAKAYSFNITNKSLITTEDKVKLEEIFANVNNGNYDMIIYINGCNCPNIYISNGSNGYLVLWCLQQTHMYDRYLFNFSNDMLTSTKWEKVEYPIDAYKVELSKPASPSGAKTNVSDGFKYIKDNYATKTYVDEAVAAGGSSANIDNKTIIEQDGVLRTAIGGYYTDGGPGEIAYEYNDGELSPIFETVNTDSGEFTAYFALPNWTPLGEEWVGKELTFRFIERPTPIDGEIECVFKDVWFNGVTITLNNGSNIVADIIDNNTGYVMSYPHVAENSTYYENGRIYGISLGVAASGGYTPIDVNFIPIDNDTLSIEGSTINANPLRDMIYGNQEMINDIVIQIDDIRNSGVSEDRVNELINEALGVIENGTY